jgi:3-deoxy-D-arabino-heptulosonate 7-phosphate (DAHP) synthase
MIDIKQFDLLKKNSAKSFNDQKALIKKLMAGRMINCPDCGKALELNLPKGNQSAKQGVQKKKTGYCCIKGCTDVELDFDI